MGCKDRKLTDIRTTDCCSVAEFTNNLALWNRGFNYFVDWHLKSLAPEIKTRSHRFIPDSTIHKSQNYRDSSNSTQFNQ
ncbi:hypothetical protein [Coleofasciculus sp. FACHB-501]|uniref:hypothetical protein n=1 Tax=Coleofasciculus sp. FACHB-501 TaxID=2692786 RepID=UPI001689C7E4|nr:hypothetical protein [Coleofasciculus sp. FACHB-501]MBD1840827.1 hypothetical protein [Coleofasciculus sp. FACHB-501]